MHCECICVTFKFGAVCHACHSKAILKCLSHVLSTLTVKIASDFGMSYLQDVHVVLDLVSLCRPHTNLNIHLSCYHDNNELTLCQLKSLKNIKLLKVASLRISFLSISSRSTFYSCFSVKHGLWENSHFLFGQTLTSYW